MDGEYFDENHIRLQEMIEKQEDLIETQESMIVLYKSEIQKLDDQIIKSEGSQMVYRWAAEEARYMVKEYAKLLKGLGKKEELSQAEKWLEVFGE